MSKLQGTRRYGVTAPFRHGKLAANLSFRPLHAGGNIAARCPYPQRIASQPAPEPLPRLSLHLGVEFVRGVVKPRAALLRRAGLPITRIELVEAGAPAVEVEESVLGAVDHQQGAWHRLRGDVRIIQITIEAGNQLRVANGVSDVAAEL